MANTKVTGDVIANGTISTVHLADDAITAAKLDSTATGITFADLTVDTDTLYVDAANNRVGIGTTSPHNDAGGLSISVASSTDQLYLERTGSATGRYYLGAASNSFYIVDDAQSATRMAINSSGNVGIGTASPTVNKLQVEDSTDGLGIAIKNTGTGGRTYGIQSTGGTSGYGQGKLAFVDEAVGARMVIDSSGNVGIGTTSPNTRLEVQGGTGSGTYAHATFTGTANRGLKISTTSSPHGQNNATVLYDSQDTEGYSEQHWLLGGNTKMVLDKNGNLGIGTNLPQNILHLKSNDPKIYLEDGNAGTNEKVYVVYPAGSQYVLQTQTDAFGAGQQVYVVDRTGTTVDGQKWYINNSAALVLDSVGNVGIGTTSPAQELDVVGIIKSSGASNSLMFSDRNTASNTWEWYSSGNNAGLYKNHNVAETVMTINSSGKVGIGTPAPSEMLHIKGGGSGPEIRLEGTWGSHYIRAYNDNWNFLVGGTVNAINIKNNGNVGFGATAPDIFGRFYAKTLGIQTSSGIAKIQIDGSSYSGIDLGQGGTRYGELNASATIVQLQTLADIPLTFGTGTSATERMRIDSSGNVGIGTSSPAQKLTIDGTVSGAYVRISNAGSGDVSSGYMIYNGSNLDFNVYTNPTFGNTTLLTREALAIRAGGAERMRVTSGGKTLIGMTSEQNAGRLQIDSGTSENGGILDIAGSGWYRYYTRVCRNATSAQTAGYWHIKTNIAANSNTMFLAKFYGYIYGSAQIVDLAHAGYAYSGTSTVINQVATNNGSNVNASSAVYVSANGSKVTFRIAFGTGSNFSTYFAGVFMDIAFPSPAGQGHDFEIEAQSFSTNTTVY